ncbi:hypothetical protein OG613_46435 (plasmid) [Streptomyces sp. NBC_00015]|uniref:hypothetical protein n=1 Tax=Streptomyces sp. NBC_00015 TaxID=2903611 RepID=UPI003244A1A1
MGAEDADDCGDEDAAGQAQGNLQGSEPESPGDGCGEARQNGQAGERGVQDADYLVEEVALCPGAAAVSATTGGGLGGRHGFLVISSSREYACWLGA